jgi:hypothetical protein
LTTPQPPTAPGNPDPWAYPGEAGLAAPSPDLLVSPAEAALERGPRRRSPLVLVAAAMVVALVLGGAAYAGKRLWYGSGAQPEAATPSTAVAFARLDLSPGYGQGLKVNNLFKKFPREGGKDAVDELKQGIFEALDIDEASYREHVEPWFAERVGVALWLDDTKRPYGLVVLASDDESAARAGLTELRRRHGADKFGFGVRDGYALVAMGEQEAQAAADAAGEDAERESLADSVQFRDDVDWLPARQTALAWGDLGKVRTALTGMTRGGLDHMLTGLDEDGPSAAPMLGGAFLAPGFRGGVPFGDLKGRVVVGAQATGSGLEIRFRGFGIDAAARPATADVRSSLDSLPADSVVAASGRAGDLGGAFPALVPDVDQAMPEELLKQLSPSEAERIRKEMRKSRERSEALEKAFSAVAGAKISLAVTEVNDTGPVLAASAETASAEKAATLADSVRRLAGEVEVTRSGNKVELRTEGYSAGGATLAGDALYREALDGAPENASALLYVDVQGLLADTGMTDDERRQARAVKAVGLATGIEDEDVVGLMRVVIK